MSFQRLFGLNFEDEGAIGNENIATYFWYFGSFDEKRTYENYVMSRVFATPLKLTKIFIQDLLKHVMITLLNFFNLG